ncbi:MAG TPA: ankyrin repeat domain-containing protein [Chryseosolibacter sp.]
MSLREVINTGKVDELEDLLKSNPSLANQEIALSGNPALAHPLHRVCDGVFNGNYTEATATEIAKILLKHGASVNPNKASGNDSPLTAACSLHCDQLALLYINEGADIDHQGCHGGTALHWASWCGRDVVVKKLVTMVRDINQRCIDFKSTPLFWALHGYRFGGARNKFNQVNCARILLQHGADPSIPNFEGYLPHQLLEPEDTELKALFDPKN